MVTGSGEWRARLTATEPTMRCMALDELPTSMTTTSSERPFKAPSGPRHWAMERGPYRRLRQNRAKRTTQANTIARQSADLRFQWGERGDSNPDTQDHNNAAREKRPRKSLSFRDSWLDGRHLLALERHLGPHRLPHSCPTRGSRGCLAPAAQRCSIRKATRIALHLAPDELHYPDRSGLVPNVCRLGFQPGRGTLARSR